MGLGRRRLVEADEVEVEVEVVGVVAAGGERSPLLDDEFLGLLARPDLAVQLLLAREARRLQLTARHDRRLLVRFYPLGARVGGDLPRLGRLPFLGLHHLHLRAGGGEPLADEQLGALRLL